MDDAARRIVWSGLSNQQTDRGRFQCWMAGFLSLPVLGKFDEQNNVGFDKAQSRIVCVDWFQLKIESDYFILWRFNSSRIALLILFYFFCYFCKIAINQFQDVLKLDLLLPTQIFFRFLLNDRHQVTFNHTNDPFAMPCLPVFFSSVTSIELFFYGFMIQFIFTPDGVPTTLLPFLLPVFGLHAL